MPHLYPEVDEHGDLARVFEAEFRRRGITADRFFTPDDREDSSAWRSARIIAGDRRAAGWLYSGERRFWIQVSRAKNIWAEGETTDLAEAVDLFAAWFAGASLRELLSRFPFLSANLLQVAYDDGDPVGGAWEWCLGNDAYYPRLQPLLRAVHADARLRELLPMVGSHDDSADFHLDPDDSAAGVINVRLPPSGSYTVKATWQPGETTGDLDTAVARISTLAAERTA